MMMTRIKLSEWFCRLTLSAGLLSAVADRFGFWPKDISVWGSWPAFAAYTQQLNPFVPAGMIHALAGAATFLEVLFGLMLLIPFRTVLFARLTGALLIIFGISMMANISVKAPLDYSVFSGAACAFALAELVIVQRRERF